ncbi:cytochrome P450 CYP72A616-like [Cryptomeria japonica]|uniref:cytochrome P450 CYP72A616-like n=1 Tax=Cryptomeria japonica TaxID=3369 RepID=UPI0027DA94A9|nr:cytochrome P450 CYP72A616-like [Cryptomeria japonica]
MVEHLGYVDIFTWKDPQESPTRGIEGDQEELSWILSSRECNSLTRKDIPTRGQYLIGDDSNNLKRVANILDGWSKLILSGASEIDVQKEFHDLTADVISRTAFGSSYTEGKHIFEMQTKQTILAVDSRHSVYIPGFRFLPTAKNRQRWNVEKEIRRSLRKIIDGRERTAITEKSGRYGADLLGLMMSESKEQGRGNAKSNGSLSTEEIIDECKTFYFAGHETTSVLLTWAIILLGIHQDWQEQGRREVLQVCGKNNYPDAECLNRLKIVRAILYKLMTLRR